MATGMDTRLNQVLVSKLPARLLKRLIFRAEAKITAAIGPVPGKMPRKTPRPKPRDILCGVSLIWRIRLRVSLFQKTRGLVRLFFFIFK